MKTQLIFMVVGLFLSLGPSFGQVNNDVVDGDKIILAGHQWKIVGDAKWQLDEKTGTVSSRQGKGFVETDVRFDDFVLRLEFWSGKNTNSGIFFRCEDGKEINDKNCYEANIFDKRPDQSGRTGGIVHIAPPSKIIETEERWNTYEIRVDGHEIEVILNGVKTVQVQDTTHIGPGRVALQFAGGEIKFRHIEFKQND